MATILLCGVDLFFRGKLEALLAGHHLITVEHTDPPDLVIVDISRVDAEEVAEAYPDVPILVHGPRMALQRRSADPFDRDRFVHSRFAN